MMKLTPDQRTSDDINANLSAELQALRRRTSIMHRVVELLQGRLKASGQETDVSVVEVNDPLPPHPSRAEPPPDQNVWTQSGEDELVEDDRRSFAVPRGAAWWPTREDSVQALRPNPGWEFYGIGSSAPVVGFLLQGMSADELETAVTLVRTTQRYRPNFVPIFLTDYPDLLAFRKHGYTAEYLASPAIGDDQSLGDSHDRLQVLEQKWNISQFLELDPKKLELPAIGLVDNRAEEDERISQLQGSPAKSDEDLQPLPAEENKRPARKRRRRNKPEIGVQE